MTQGMKSSATGGEISRRQQRQPLLPTAVRARLRSWHRTWGRHTLPWRRDRSPWGILVAETLLRRTRAETAARIYSMLLSEFPEPSAVVASPARWTRLTRPLGLAW